MKQMQIGKMKVFHIKLQHVGVQIADKMLNPSFLDVLGATSLLIRPFFQRASVVQ
jgi:hypothetical protein